MKITSIDIGRKNLAIFVYNTKKRKVVFWKNINTELSVFNSNKYRKILTKVFLQLPESDLYLLEKQVPIPENHKNLIIESILNCIITFYYGKNPIIVNPKDVSNYFKLTKDRYYKKRDAVAIIKQMIIDPNRDIIIPEKEIEEFESSKKQDDLADSFLQCIWYHETHILKSKSTFKPDVYKTHKEYKLNNKKRKLQTIEIIEEESSDSDFLLESVFNTPKEHNSLSN